MNCVGCSRSIGLSEAIKKARAALDSLADSVRDGSTSAQTLQEQWGWNCPALDRFDLARLASHVSERYGQINTTDVDEDLANLIDEIPGKVEKFKSGTLAYLYNGKPRELTRNLHGSSLAQP